MSEESKPAPKKKTAAKKAGKPVIYRSREQEPREFPILGIRARRNDKHPGRCEWHVPADKAEDFEKQFHIVQGRVLKV